MKSFKNKLFNFLVCFGILFTAFIPAAYSKENIVSSDFPSNTDNISNDLPHYIIGSPTENENFGIDINKLKELGVGEKTLSEIKYLLERVGNES